MTPTFTDLGVDASVVRRLAARGIEMPFPVQEATIPAGLADRDIVAKAPTGSGKTLAFGIPAASVATGSDSRRPRALVLEPTRELAGQVAEELGTILDGGPKRVFAVYGGTRYQPADIALRKGIDVLVACPGRLEDLLEQGAVSLEDTSYVVIDEADRMADMGFLPVVKRILDQTADERQVLLFSATMGKEVEKLAARYLKDPVRVEVEADEEASGDVSHLFWHVSREERTEACASAISQLGQAIVFCRTRRGAERVAKSLERLGISSVAIHGDRSQSQRERALRSIESGEARALVATDVAARGIHLDGLPGVIHWDPPADATDYTHRSGRTGRAGADGIVISLVVDDQRGPVKRIQKELGLPVGFGEVEPLGVEPRVIEPKPKRSREGERRSERPRSTRHEHGRGERRHGDRPEHKERRHGDRPEYKERRSERLQRDAGRRERPGRPEEGGQTGIVKFFDPRKGYGFVARRGEEDLFVHASGLAGGGELEEGQKVSYEIGRGKRGDEARNVRIVGRNKPSGGPRKRSTPAAGKRMRRS